MDDEDVCGETIEHDLVEVGLGVWLCRRCDAEIIEEVDDLDAAESE